VTVCVETVALGKKSVVVRVAVGADANGVVLVGSHELFTCPPSWANTVGIDSRYSMTPFGGKVEVISEAG